MNEQGKYWIRHVESDSYIFWEEKPFLDCSTIFWKEKTLGKMLHMISLQKVK